MLYLNTITSQHTKLHVQSMTGILPIKKMVKEYFLLKQLYEIEPYYGLC